MDHTKPVGQKAVDATTEPIGIDYQPVEVHVITSIEELRAIANPLRVRILECLMADPLSVRDVGKALGTNSTNLYYHVGELEKAGLVKFVHAEVQSGIQVKYYRATARYYYLGLALLHGSSDEVHASAEFMASLLENLARELRRSFSRGLIDQHRDAFVVTHRRARLSPDAASLLRRRIEELDADVRDQNQPEGALSVEFCAALFPESKEC